MNSMRWLIHDGIRHLVRPSSSLGNGNTCIIERCFSASLHSLSDLKGIQNGAIKLHLLCYFARAVFSVCVCFFFPEQEGGSYRNVRFAVKAAVNNINKVKVHCLTKATKLNFCIYNLEVWRFKVRMSHLISNYWPTLIDIEFPFYNILTKCFFDLQKDKNTRLDYLKWFGPAEPWC